MSDDVLLNANMDTFVFRRDLDAFIYDGPVLQYEVYQDNSETCQLLIEGTWYAHTGYGLAFARHSKYLSAFNSMLMEYKENGMCLLCFVLKKFYAGSESSFCISMGFGFNLLFVSKPICQRITYLSNRDDYVSFSSMAYGALKSYKIEN